MDRLDRGIGSEQGQRGFAGSITPISTFGGAALKKKGAVNGAAFS
jgi:hypothetical protein